MLKFMFKSKTASDASSENENPHSDHHVFNNIQTQFSNFIRQLIPKKSMFPREIRDRFNRIPVYSLYLSGTKDSYVRSEITYRGVSLFFFNEDDALGLLQDQADSNAVVKQVPFSQILDDYPIRGTGLGFPHASRLVPDKSQIYNATKLKEMQNKNSDFDGDDDGVNIFSGVPVFQSQVFNAILEENPNRNNHSPRAFFRKEDLEKSLDEVIGSDRTNSIRDTIQVAALEDIINEMKDCSTSSKWKHVVFIPPGEKITNNQTLDLDINSN